MQTHRISRTVCLLAGSFIGFCIGCFIWMFTAGTEIPVILFSFRWPIICGLVVGILSFLLGPRFIKFLGDLFIGWGIGQP